MSNIYRKEFEVGTFGYQLDIIPAGTSQLSDITYVTIDDRAMDFKSEWTAEFDDDLPFGITKADSLNIEFDFLYLPIELQNYLINPIVNTTYSITANSTTLSKDIYLSNTYILRCNFGGSSYIDIYYGTQKRSVETKFNYSIDGIVCELEINSLAKIITEIITPDMIYYELVKQCYAGTLTTKDVTKCYDLMWYEDGIPCSYTSGSFDESLIGSFVRFTDLFAVIGDLINNIAKLYFRADGTYSTITNHCFISLNFYKQYLGSDNVNNFMLDGAEITDYNSLYFCGWTYLSGYQYSIDNHTGGALVNIDDEFNIYKYDNLYDFLKSVSESYFCKLILTVQNSKMNFIFLKPFESNSLNSTDKVFTLADANDEEFEVTKASEKVVRRSVKCNIDDMPDSNYTDINFTKIGSVAEKDFEFKALWHNMPYVQDQEYSKNTVSTKTDNFVESNINITDNTIYLPSFAVNDVVKFKCDNGTSWPDSYFTVPMNLPAPLTAGTNYKILSSTSGYCTLELVSTGAAVDLTDDGNTNFTYHIKTKLSDNYYNGTGHFTAYTEYSAINTDWGLGFHNDLIYYLDGSDLYKVHHAVNINDNTYNTYQVYYSISFNSNSLTTDSNGNLSIDIDRLNGHIINIQQNHNLLYYICRRITEIYSNPNCMEFEVEFDYDYDLLPFNIGDVYDLTEANVVADYLHNTGFFRSLFYFITSGKKATCLPQSIKFDIINNTIKINVVITGVERAV